MMGPAKYERRPFDHYRTEPRCTEAFLEVFGDDLEGMIIWEPACGDGAISKVLQPHCRALVNTDIHAYEGFDPDGVFDFFKIVTDLQRFGGSDFSIPSMRTIEELTGFRPDAIITNPPYGKEAAMFARQGLKLLEDEKGFMALLCRHDWDCAKGRKDLFDHPAFRGKVTLRFRPIWIDPVPGEKKVSPRFNYAWYVWDWSKVHIAAGLRPEMFYAG